MTDEDFDSWAIAIHKRLLDRDPIAPAELVQGVLGRLDQRMRRAFPTLSGDEIVYDAIVDTVMSYVRNPAQFDPSMRGLLGYLAMSAEGDVKNSLARAERRRLREIPLIDVELGFADGNKDIEEDEQTGIFYGGIVADPPEVDWITGLANEINDPADREALVLLASGERSTSKFAAVWGYEKKPKEEQGRLVKRDKDRLKKQLQRLKQRTMHDGE